MMRNSRGFIYIFGAQEKHSYKYRFAWTPHIHPSVINWRYPRHFTPRRFEYTIAWKLTEIRSPSGERMVFRYEEDTAIDRAFREFLEERQFLYVNDFIPRRCSYYDDEIRPRIGHL